MSNQDIQTPESRMDRVEQALASARELLLQAAATIHGSIEGTQDQTAPPAVMMRS